MKSIGDKLIESLEGFLRKLESDESIECIQVRRFKTPDGPMHVQEKKVLNGREDVFGQDD